MKFLTALLLIVAAFLGALVLLPLVGAGLALSIPFAFVFIWLLPIIIIACSDKVTGGEKLAWILAIIFLSWFAWIFYFLLAPIKQRPLARAYDDRRYYYE